MKKSRIIGESLARVHEIIQGRNGIHIVHTSEVTRKDRELLVGAGWLQEIIQGWYLLVRPDVQLGDSSSWYANFWDFLSVYLAHYYKDNYCISAEGSLDLHLGVSVVPKQVIVMAEKGRGEPLELPFDTSLLIYASKEYAVLEREVLRGVHVMSLPYALCKVSPTFFEKQPLEAQIALQSIASSDDLLRVIVSNNFIRAAGRLVGAYRFLGNTQMCDEMLKGLKKVNIKIQEINPFEEQSRLLSQGSSSSPYAARINAMWQKWRKDISKHFPKPKGLPKDPKQYVKQVDERYSQDAYHSLSIEGYRVDEELIESVKNAKWNPENNFEDSKESNALTARGYYEAFQAMKISLDKIFAGKVAGEVIASDLADWYQSLFAPFVKAGIIEPSDLFGYRKHQVYIRNSRHTPLPVHALKDAMDAFFYCLKEEEHAGVRAVLGHFIFVYIHPYMDGNGRLGRLLMNAMLASGGYPWKIVHLEHRRQYLETLEEASVEGNIIPFVKFLCAES